MNTKKLQSILPGGIYAELADVMEHYAINTPMRLAHFLGQCHHETGGWKFLEENLNYSANGLKATFPHYFSTDAMAAEFAHQPQKIADLVYAGRMGNGTFETGDGWKYRGRGCIQLTGHNNYALFSNACPENVVQNPDLVKTKYALTSAAWFWDRNSLNGLADRYGKDAVVLITRRVNGGTLGLADREAQFNHYLTLLQ